MTFASAKHTAHPVQCEQMVMESISREFRVALPRGLLYADDLVVIDADDLAVIGETEEELMKRLNEWKDNVESKGMRISGERQKVKQKAVRWPCWPV